MKKTVVLLIALVLCIPAITFAANGQPFQDLQNQINQLKSMIENIQLTPGPQGPPGVSGYEMVEVHVNVENLIPQETAWCEVPCPDGKVVFGGGGATVVSQALAMYDSFPVKMVATGKYMWVVEWRNPWNDPMTTEIICRAICGYAQ